jgi:hypothetical protein
MDSILDELEREEQVVRIRVAAPVRGDWYVHGEHFPLLRELCTESPEFRTTLLSPFDNLISDRGRVQLLFDFDFASEIYKPKDARGRGYYALPILADGGLVGSVEASVDKDVNRLVVRRLVTSRSRLPATTRRLVAEALHDLARFAAGSSEFSVDRTVPASWRSHLY